MAAYTDNKTGQQLDGRGNDGSISTRRAVFEFSENTTAEVGDSFQSDHLIIPGDSLLRNVTVISSVPGATDVTIQLQKRDITGVKTGAWENISLVRGLTAMMQFISASYTDFLATDSATRELRLIVRAAGARKTYNGGGLIAVIVDIINL